MIIDDTFELHVVSFLVSFIYLTSQSNSLPPVLVMGKNPSLHSTNSKNPTRVDHGVLLTIKLHISQRYVVSKGHSMTLALSLDYRSN